MRYIETFLIYGVVIHIIFVKISAMLLGIKVRKGLLGISILLDIVYMLLYVYLPYEIEAYQVLFILIITVLPFISKSIKEMILGSFLYLLGNFSLGGISEIFYHSCFFSFVWVLFFLLI